MLNLVVIRSQDIEKLASFYSAMGFRFVRHRHGSGPEHLSCSFGTAIFEIYPAASPSESTTGTRLGFVVPALADTLNRLRGLCRLGKRACGEDRIAAG